MERVYMYCTVSCTVVRKEGTQIVSTCGSVPKAVFQKATLSLYSVVVFQHFNAWYGQSFSYMRYTVSGEWRPLQEEKGKKSS